MRKKSNAIISNSWQSWYDQRMAVELEKNLPKEKVDKEPLQWSDKTIEDYREILDGFGGVTMLPASYEKRFIRSMRGLGEDTKLTVKQCRLIEELYHRYRRQIPGHKKLCVICGETK